MEHLNGNQVPRKFQETLIAAVKRLRAYANTYLVGMSADHTVGGLRSLFAEAEMTTPPGVRLPLFRPEIWPELIVHDPREKRGGKWIPAHAFQWGRQGSRAACRAWLDEIAAIADAVGRLAEAETEQPKTQHEQQK